MKVLHLSTTDISGGAARAAYRLHKGLQEIGVESYMLVQTRISKDSSVLSTKNLWNSLFYKFFTWIDTVILSFYPQRDKVYFSLDLKHINLLRKIRQINPDIIVLNWVSGFMGINQLKKFHKPVLWIQHDMWAFTGGCHYNRDCIQFKTSCGNCPLLNSRLKNDLSSIEFKKKQKTYNRTKNLYIIALSSWMGNCVTESELFKDKTTIHIPNGIETEIFQPRDKNAAREIFHLPANRKLILFGASWATAEKRKGFDYLLKALEFLKDGNCELIVFGEAQNDLSKELPCKIYFMGHLNDDVSLSQLYSAADVMVVPSIQENLSNAIMESMSCGTPVVAFGIGGNGDMIEHKKNGYLASPFDVKDLALGIQWVYEDDKRWETLSSEARLKVLRDYSCIKIAGEHLNLYQKILNGSAIKPNAQNIIKSSILDFPPKRVN
ncbi:MAG: glycosyltransferase family 4 protein [Bacteroidota bacterium]|nr:glycosyltransferase family 4 protein [Bacteroidota bacterium]